MRDTTLNIDSRSGARRSSTGIELALLIVALVGMPLIIAAVSGALQIPRNDDWAFSRIAFDFARTGQFHLVGWNDMMLLGQIVLAFPIVKLFGQSIVGLHLLGVALGAGGLIATHFVAREFLSHRRALFIVLITGLFPGFGLSSTTFMTDVPAYAAQFGCLALGFIAFRASRHRQSWLTGALFVGMAGFTIREFAIAAPLAVIVGAFVLERTEISRARAWTTFGIRVVVVVGLALLLFHLRHSLPGDTLGGFGFHLDSGQLEHTTQAFITLAFGLAPAIVWRVKRGRLEPSRIFNLGAFVLVPLALFVMSRSAGDPTCCSGASSSVFVGNLLTEHGALGNETLMGSRPPVFANPLWFLVMGLAVAAAVVLAGLIWSGAARSAKGWTVKLRRETSPAAWSLMAFGVLSLAGVLARGIVDGYLFDRYLWTLVPVIGVWLMLDSGPTHSDASRAAIAVTVLLTVVFVGNITMSDSFDAARWSAGNQGVASGVPASDIDAGFEWVGFHYAGVAGPATTRRSVLTPPGYMFYFPRAGNCVMVSASPLASPDDTQIGTVVYRGAFGLGTNELFVYRNRPACDLAT